MKINKYIPFFIVLLSLIFAFILSNSFNKKTILSNIVLDSTNITNNESVEDIKVLYDWQIFIPKLGVYAPIKEGSTKEVLRSYVGHVEGTSFTDGNICLAAHNNTANYKSRNILL